MVSPDQLSILILATLSGGAAGVIITLIFSKNYIEKRFIEENESNEYSQHLQLRQTQIAKYYDKEIEILPKLWEDTLHAVTVTHSLMKHSRIDTIQEKLKEALSIQVQVSQSLRNVSIFLDEELEKHFDTLLIKCNSSIIEVNNNHSKDFSNEADTFRDECGVEIATISVLIKERLQIHL